MIRPYQVRKRRVPPHHRSNKTQGNWHNPHRSVRAIIHRCPHSIPLTTRDQTRHTNTALPPRRHHTLVLISVHKALEWVSKIYSLSFYETNTKNTQAPRSPQNPDHGQSRQRLTRIHPQAQKRNSQLRQIHRKNHHTYWVYDETRSGWNRKIQKAIISF